MGAVDATPGGNGESRHAARSAAADRDALFDALTAAVMPGHGPSVLVVARIEVGSPGTPAPSQALLERVERRLSTLLPGEARVYRARRGEFWTLLAGSLDAQRTLLDSIAPEIAAAAPVGRKQAGVGVAALPDEASSPEAAVALAHQRLRSSRESGNEEADESDDPAAAAPDDRPRGGLGSLPGKLGRLLR